MEFSNKLLRTYIYTRKKLQKNKYLKREIVNVFKCKDCTNELHLRNSDINKSTGTCRVCSDKRGSGGKKTRIKPYQALFNTFKYKTKKDGKKNTLTYKQFLEFVNYKYCHYCYDNIYWTEFNLNKNGSSHNLDRKDNNKGYSIDNCVPCCWKCNEAKSSSYTYEEWYGMTKYFRDKK